MKVTKTLFPNLDLQQSNVDEDTFVGEHLEDILELFHKKIDDQNIISNP